MTSKFLAVVSIAVMLMMAFMVEASEFIGSWKGTLTGADDSAVEVQIDFSQQGFPLYSYTNNKGVARQAELAHVGQTVEYVPAGGGVQRLVVNNLEKGQGRLLIGLLFSFEKASQGYLQQKQESALFEYSLAAEGLQLRITTQATSHFGDKDMIEGGNPRQPSSTVSYRRCVDP